MSRTLENNSKTNDHFHRRRKTKTRNIISKMPQKHEKKVIRLKRHQTRRVG
jgi:hypothetical protein